MVQGIIVIRTLAGAWILLAAVGVRGSQGSANQPDPTRPVAVFVVDLASDGFQLVSADKGVTFDIDGAGAGARIGWTASSSDDSFLFLDRNRNGVVDNGLELLGNGTRYWDG